MGAELVPVDSVKVSQRRALYWLAIAGDRFCNAHAEFPRLSERVRQYFMKSFDMWIDEVFNDARYHGWPPSAYKNKYIHCFVFKHREIKLRIYSAVINGSGALRRRYCLMMHLVKKQGDQTDENELRKVEEHLAMRQVIEVVGQLD